MNGYGARDAANAHAFEGDVAERLGIRVQLTSDDNRLYVDAVENHLGGMVDYAMLVKQYGNEQSSPHARYPPAKCQAAKKWQTDGNPDMARVSAS